MNLGIIVDSYVGLNQQEIEKKGFYFLPLSILFDQKEYIAGVNIDTLQTIEKMKSAKKSQTSQPSQQKIIDLFKKVQKKHDHVFYFTFPEDLSSTYQSAKKVAQDFKNITVISSYASGNSIFEIIKKIQALVTQKVPFAKIVTFIDDFMNKCFTVIIPKTLDALQKGGRVKKIGQVIMDKLKIIPILTLSKKNGLEKNSLRRTQKKAIKQGIKIIQEKNKNIGDYHVGILHNGDINITNTTIDFCKASFSAEYQKEKDFLPEICSPVLAVHTGESAIGLFSFPAIKD